MIQRVHLVEAIKHPWRLDMAKVIESGGSDTAGYNGFIGRVEFTETPFGLVMDGKRRRLVQPNQDFEPQIRIMTPWANVKWCEHGPAQFAPSPSEHGDPGSPRAPRGGAARERPLGA